ncbi:MAG: hypothetical protein D6732_25225 [Methanobacteriota archaeon]|nr:MAG: hypothetical protein D6732_25225 [Euryarchaeota archaeon]
MAFFMFFGETPGKPPFFLAARRAFLRALIPKCSRENIIMLFCCRLKRNSYQISSKEKVMATQPTDAERVKIKTVLRFQFPELNDVEIPNLRISRSKKTKRVNEIYSGEKLLFSLRPMDGRYIPTMSGGEFLLKNGLRSHLVVAMEEAVPFVSQGKSLYNRHVLESSENISPNSEVLVLDPQRNLIAVGTSKHPSYAMVQLDYGVAVKVKHYYKN